jgi:hypothetical protein
MSIGFTSHAQDGVVSDEKTSNQPRVSPTVVKLPVLAKLDAKSLDAIVGNYEFPPQTQLPTGFTLKATGWFTMKLEFQVTRARNLRATEHALQRTN